MSAEYAMTPTRVHHATLLILLAAGAGGLKNVRITVPEAVASGSTVTLYCRYDLETDSLYSVKWYNGIREFFRYIPKELPHTKIFPMYGVNVDVGRSGPTSVVLRGVKPSSSGRYRCEVSADAPSFHTIMHSSSLQVVDIPNGPPVVEAERTRVAAGDTLVAKCTSRPSEPAANLTWFLNGQPVNTTHQLHPAKIVTRKDPVVVPTTTTTTTTTTMNPTTVVNSLSDEDWSVTSTTLWPDPTRRNREGAWRTVSTLTLVVKEEALREGTLKLTCKTSLYHLYSANSDLSLAAEKPQTASVLVLATGHTDSGSFASSPTIRPLLIAVGLFIIMR